MPEPSALNARSLAVKLFLRLMSEPERAGAGGARLLPEDDEGEPIEPVAEFEGALSAGAADACDETLPPRGLARVSGITRPSSAASAMILLVLSTMSGSGTNCAAGEG